MSSSLIYGALLLIVGIAAVRRIRAMFSSGFDVLDGPSSPGWLIGHFASLSKPDGVAKAWIKEYGTTFRLSGFFGTGRLYTTDPVALQYIISQHSDRMTRTHHFRKEIASSTGPGVLVVEGDDYKRQRKILNPVFTTSQVRKLVPIFFDKAAQAVALWTAQSGQSGRTINVLPILARATLDVIGEASFGCRFDSLGGGSKIADLFRRFFDGSQYFSFWELLYALLPALRHIPTSSNREYKAKVLELKTTCQDIVRKKMAELAASPAAEKANMDGKDLLSAILKSNFAHGTGGMGLSDDEVLAQIATFAAAGHETSATGLAWTMYCLARNTEAQKKLREEVMALPHDQPDMEILQALPYLDSVLKESLRLHPPLHFNTRQMTIDQIIPLSSPVIGKGGELVHEIRAMRGDVVLIDLSEINRNPTFWGDDADDFRPERWDSIPAVGPGYPSLYAHTLTFGGGAKGCIGWKMAVIEMKVFLFNIFRHFELGIDPNVKVYRRIGKASTGRPVVQGQEHVGDQMPLTLRPIPT